MKYKIAETISSKDLFNKFMEETKSPQEAAFRLLDVLTNGAFAAVEEPRRQELIDKTIAKFTNQRTSKVNLSKSQWEDIGRFAGWNALDPIEFSDADIDPSYDAQDEEDTIFGKDEDYSFDNALQAAFDSGYAYGLKYDDTVGMPYRQDTENGIELAKRWFMGFKSAREELVDNQGEI